MVTGDIDKFQRQIFPVTEEITDTEDKLAIAQKRKRDADSRPTPKDIEKTCDSIRAAFPNATFEQKRELLNSIQFRVVTLDGKIKIEGALEIELLPANVNSDRTELTQISRYSIPFILAGIEKDCIPVEV